MTKKYVLTGGPGVGKSTLLYGLHKKGYYVMEEIAEYLIKLEQEKKGSIFPWTNRDAFQKRVLEKQLEWEREIPSEIKISFQDRGIADGIGFYKADGLNPPKEFYDYAKKAAYTKVFLLDPLRIYENTQIRREDMEIANRIHEEIKKAYENTGYKIIRIAPAPIEERVKQIISHLDKKIEALVA